MEKLLFLKLFDPDETYLLIYYSNIIESKKCVTTLFGCIVVIN